MTMRGSRNAAINLLFESSGEQRRRARLSFRPRPIKFRVPFLPDVVLQSLLNGDTEYFRIHRECLTTPFGSTLMRMFPINVAAAAGDPDVVKELLRLGAGANQGDCDGNTSLHYATLAGHSAVVRVLIDHGANPNCENVARTTPLHDAARFGGSPASQLSILAALANNGARLDVRNIYGNTPAHRAVLHAHHEFLDALLQRCPHLAAMETRRGFTPLDLAYGKQDFTAIQLLTRRGANHSDAWRRNAAFGPRDFTETIDWADFQALRSGT